jgi:hypothetical protein
MAISFDIVDKFTATLIDFWTLRPRAFLESVENDPSRYLSPPQFLLACTGLISGLYVISLAAYKDLSEETLNRFPPLRLRSDTTIVASRQILFLIVFLVVYSLYIRLASWWPIRGKASFKDILYFQFYALSLNLPYLVLEVILTPFILNYIDHSVSATSIRLLFVLPIANLVVGVPLAFIYILPGQARLNGVSTGQMFIGLFVFGLVAEFVIGVLVFISYIVYIIFTV